MSTPTIYFVAGATRGLGLALVANIASRDPSAIVYAGGRNLAGSPQLDQLAAKYPGHIEIVKYIAGDKEGNEAVAKAIQEKHGHVDTVIANAAISKPEGKIHETTPESFQEHFAINVIGPIVLFQAFRDLLKVSSLPRFLAISSGAGSIKLLEQTPFDAGSYGTSKAALNWVLRKIHFENDWLISYPQCPGAVDTDMLKEGLANDTSGRVAEVFETNLFTVRQPDEVANILVDILTTSTRETNGGQFHNIDKERYPW